DFVALDVVASFEMMAVDGLHHAAGNQYSHDRCRQVEDGDPAVIRRAQATGVKRQEQEGGHSVDDLSEAVNARMLHEIAINAPQPSAPPTDHSVFNIPDPSPTRQRGQGAGYLGRLLAPCPCWRVGLECRFSVGLTGNRRAPCAHPERVRIRTTASTNWRIP